MVVVVAVATSNSNPKQTPRAFGGRVLRGQPGVRNQEFLDSAFRVLRSKVYCRLLGFRLYTGRGF